MGAPWSNPGHNVRADLAALAEAAQIAVYEPYVYLVTPPTYEAMTAHEAATGHRTWGQDTTWTCLEESCPACLL